MPSFRNPSGITYGYTSLDKMLPALSKLGVFLFIVDFSVKLLGQDLLAIDDVNSLCGVFYFPTL